MSRCRPFWQPLSVVSALTILMLTPPAGAAQPTRPPAPTVMQPLSLVPTSPAILVAPTSISPGEVVVPPPNALTRFPTPGKNTIGLAWGAQKFWAADRGETESWIYYCNNPCSVWVKFFQWKEGSLGTIAWGDGGLWVVDEQRGKIVFVDLAPPVSRFTKQVTIPEAALRQPPAITGLAWDGGALWLVTGCGLCSSFYRVDPTTESVTQHFFPRCEPRGLAYALVEGKGHLWTVAYNGPTHRPRVSLRDLTEDPKSVLLSHRLRPFISDSSLPEFPTNPTAITFALGKLWVVDRVGLGTIFSFSAKVTLE